MEVTIDEKSRILYLPVQLFGYNSVNVFLKNIVGQNNFLLNEDIR